MTRPIMGTCHQSTNNTKGAGVELDTQTRPTHLQVAPQSRSNSFEEDILYQDARQETNKYACMTMSQSPLSAHNYSLNGLDKDMSISLNSATSQQAPERTIDCASCSTPSQGMCTPAAGDSATEHLYMWGIKRSKSSQQLQSMLYNAPPVIINAVHDEYNDHEVLLPYRRIPHNVVIDSVYPDLAPHIVITPAPETWDLPHIVDNNRVGFQRRPHLTVPMFFGYTCRMHTYEELMMCYSTPIPEPIMYEEQWDQQDASMEHGHCYDDDELSQTPEARSICNLDCVHFLVRSIGPEDLGVFVYDLLHSLNRRLYMATAFAASLKADGFRRRYDTPEFLESVERPYRWTDPAEPVFSAIGNRYPQELTIISPTQPFAAPHILIHSAPSNDPWTVWWNATDVQDCSFGAQLVVSSSQRSVLQYVNVPAYESQEDSSTARVLEDEDFTDASSESDSDGPETPTQLERMESDYFSGFAEIDTSHSQSQYHDETLVNEGEQCTSPFEDKVINSKTCQESQSSPKFFISSVEDWDDDDDEDEDDGLPDLETDEWFIRHRQEIAERERMRAAAIATVS